MPTCCGTSVSHVTHAIVLYLFSLQLLPRLCLETERGGVFCDSSFNYVGGSKGKLCVDFDRNVQRCVGVAGEEGDDFVGDLHETHSGGGWRYFSGAVERFCLWR